MVNLSASFTEESFRKTMEDYCGKLGYKIHTFKDPIALLVFELEESPLELECLYIVRKDGALIFEINSHTTFDDETEIPIDFTTHLMKQNADLDIGFWCNRELGGNFVYSIIHREDTRLLDYFRFEFIIQKILEARGNYHAVSNGEIM